MIELKELLDTLNIDRKKDKRKEDTSKKLNLLMRYNKEKTRRVYSSEIKRFEEYARGKPLDEWTLRGFFDYLEKKGFSRNYQRNSWYALKKYFQAKGVPWVLDSKECPKVDRTKLKRKIKDITLTKDEMERMIDVVKKNGSEKEKVFLSLTTIYAVRAGEIVQLTEKDIDRKKGIIHIQAEKGGEERYHLIPDEIKPYIYPWDFDTRLSYMRVLSIFETILEKAGIEKKEGMGPHSIRRGVFTLLCSTGLPLMRVYDFGRWKRRKELGMLAEYDNPDFEEVDKLIFSKHPLLAAWR